MAASNNSKKRKKGLISGEEIASLLTRYKVAQHPDVKIDWNALQKLWRYLAYCGSLPETVEEKLEEQPLDDADSDLEYELEAFPPATDEASLEAAAYVKVLLASGLSDDAGGSPATPCSLKGINITVPVSVQKQSPPAVTMEGINITVPVSVQKQSPPAVTTTDKGLDGTVVTTAKGLDGTVANAANQPAKRKRKPWTMEEDNELIAAVKKLGERNWANILKADIFKGDRTASQLSQRRGIIRKRLNVKSETGGGGSGIQYELTEQQLAANRAVSHALSMPLNYSLSAGCGVGLTETATVSGQQICLQTPKGTSSVTEKPLVISIKKEASVVPNPMIQAAAVAAGARIATPSTAKPLLKAAQCKTAFQTSTTGKSSMPGVTPPLTPNHSGAPANVYYIRTGLSSASPTTYPSAVPSVSTAPPPPTKKGKAPSVTALTSETTSCATMGAGKMSDVFMSAGVGIMLKEEKVQSLPMKYEVENSPKDVVKNSFKDSEIKKSSNEEEVKDSSKEEQVKLGEIEINCSADIPKDGKQDDQAAMPDSDMVHEDQTTQNLSKLPNVEAAASDPVQLEKHHIEHEKENMENSPAAAN
ncbi:hypothetical protein MKW98_004874 [Papaver atlanticum]|uniref:MYB transcription factor n=1 Tax=Papaver atlanticum TaxID=357466 RepID=A0AAD4X515_9MAGN|nr:hypothetical protein MKW98_004874 [Papaver atlanticum]